ncbi:MAG: ABC transporter ATP-binding protein [Ignavibacteriales bacterium]|nr:ABC transporter ATP-binding protein [Ignavibacteriales bacterium]
MIELRNVTKKFGSFTAVDNISFVVPPGEFFGFLGPNGAGKTTTIKMMAGLFTPTDGQILISGYDVVKEPIKAKSHTSYVPDQPFLYDKLTGREFLYFIGGLYKMEKSAIAEKIAEVIDHFEIGDWVDKRTEDYSQGMRQRVTIAAALVHQPRVLIIDEPMVGLDPRSAKIVRETLRMMARQGVSVFMSTHSLPTAEELCDRVAFIKDGRIVFMGTQENLQTYKQKLDGKFESVFLELTK